MQGIEVIQFDTSWAVRDSQAIRLEIPTQFTKGKNMSDINTLAVRARKAFDDALATAIAKNGRTKFAEAEQMAVIEAMVTFLVNDDEAMTEGFDAISIYIGAVANASQTAQALEKKGKITRVARGTGGSKAALL